MTTFWPQATAGVRYVRCELPARHLGARVLDLDEKLRWHENFWLGPQAEDEDEVFADQEGVGVWQLVANRIRFEAMRASKERFGHVVMEVDDDYVNWHPQYVRGAWIEGEPPDGTILVSSVALHRRAASLADAILVSTPWLQKVYSEYNDNVLVCRNGVEPKDWPARREDDRVFRVVFAGSPNPADLMLIQKAMEWAAQQHGVEAWVVGFNPRWRGVKTVPWIEDLAEFRARMAKLRPNVQLRPIETTLFAKSKSDLKILEAGIMGALPIVTSFDPYMAWRDTPVLFAHDPREWLRQVQWCVRNRDGVSERARECRKIVLRTRIMAKVADDWRQALAGFEEGAPVGAPSVNQT